MNTNSLVDSNDVSSAAPLILVQWYTKKKAGEWETITKFAGVTATQKNADLVHIRAGMHKTTKAANGSIKPDPRGLHYTAEYRDKKTMQFTTWHHYFKKVGRDLVVDTDASVSPNPQFWTNTKGNSAAKPAEKTTDAYKVWAWKEGAQQNVKMLPFLSGS